jgi:hypothetical protein
MSTPTGKIWKNVLAILKWVGSLLINIYIYIHKHLIGGLEYVLFSIYWEYHHPN